MKTNPNAMLSIQKNTVFTNVAETSDGGFFWEGLEKDMSPNVKITSWLGMENWTPDVGKPAAHPNSRLFDDLVIVVKCLGFGLFNSFRIFELYPN